MRPLRWQLFATHVPEGGQRGGMVRYVVEMAAALDRRDDVELHVLSGPEAAPFFTELLGPARVHLMPGVPTVGRSALERFTRWPERGGPFDVVHGTKQLLPHRCRAVRVLTVHDMNPFDRPGEFGPVKRALLRRPYLQSLREADVRICISEATRDRLEHWLPGVPSDVVPLAISDALLTAPPDPVPALAGRRFALVVGDPSPRKNLPLLIDAWDDVCARVPDAVLAVAGPPSWAESRHGESFARLAAAGKVVALGRVPDAQLRWCYEHAVVALCPSLLEGFGLPAVEALAFGTPVITSLDPALCEVSGPHALHLAADDPAAWVAAIAAAFTEPGSLPSSPGGAPRTWDDVADDTVALARAHLAGTRFPGGIEARNPSIT